MRYLAETLQKDEQSSQVKATVSVPSRLLGLSGTARTFPDKTIQVQGTVEVITEYASLAARKMIGRRERVRYGTVRLAMKRYLVLEQPAGWEACEVIEVIQKEEQNRG